MGGVDFTAAAELTGFDLAEADALRARLSEDFALEWAKTTAANVAEAAKEAVRGALQTFGTETGALAQGAAAMAPALQAVKAWNEVRALLGDQLDAAAAANVRRVWEARDKAIETTYIPGSWWTRVKGSGPAEVELKKAYKQSVASFTGQYSPEGIVFSAARALGKDVLRPSYPSSPARPVDRFYAWGGEIGIADTMPALAVKKTDAPLDCGELNFSGCSVDIGNGIFRKLYGFVCVPIDFTQGCGLPGAFWWSYCLGAAPQWGWLGQSMPLSPLGATLSAAIQAPTPYHLLINEEDVKASLSRILLRCGVLDLPEDPGQSNVGEDGGVFREKGGVRLVLRGENAPYWTPPYDGVVRPQINAVDLQIVIARHLDWLAMRRAMLLTLPELPCSLRKAAEASPDAAVRAAVAGQHPVNAWSRKDPLGLYASDGGAPQGPGGEQGQRIPGGMGGQGPGGLDSGEESGGGALFLGLGALALAGGTAYALRRRGRGRASPRRRRR